MRNQLKKIFNTILRKKTKTIPEENKTPEVKLHNDPPKTLSKHWYNIDDEKPPYYSSVDIHTGTYILKDWARVSDGQRDYYVNNRDDQVITKIKYWKKREDVIYPYYDPMTEDDVKIITANDIYKLINNIKEEYIDVDHTEYNLAIDRAIKHIEQILHSNKNNTYDKI